MGASITANADAHTYGPIAAAHILIYEDRPDPSGSYDTIPGNWAGIRFECIGVLYISPFIVNTNPNGYGSFILDPIGVR
jgi:hypothetical protein